MNCFRLFIPDGCFSKCFVSYRNIKGTELSQRWRHKENIDLHTGHTEWLQGGENSCVNWCGSLQNNCLLEESTECVRSPPAFRQFFIYSPKILKWKVESQHSSCSLMLSFWVRQEVLTVIAAELYLNMNAECFGSNREIPEGLTVALAPTTTHAHCNIQLNCDGSLWPPLHALCLCLGISHCLEMLLFAQTMSCS